MYKKLTATVTACCFLFSFVFAPALQGAAEPGGGGGELKALSEGLALPHSAGRITGGRDFGSSLAVVSIQDLHCHGEVQRNIGRILSALDRTCRVGRIYVEGAAGPVDTSWLAGIKDEQLKNELVESLVDEGRLTGAEYFSVRAARTGILRGLEDETVYAGNLARLGEILGKKDAFAQAAAALRRDLAAMKKDYFGRENRRFDALLEKHRNGGMSAFKYYRLLTKYAEKMPGGTGDYPHMTGYLELMEAGKRLHYKRTARQLQEYMRVLKERLPYPAYSLLLERTDNFSKLDEMYLALSSLPRQYRAGLSAAYPQLAEFLAYTDKSRSINPLEMVREEKRLVSGIRRSLARNTAEKEVAFLADFSGCFEDYLNNRLSAEDYRHVAENFDTFKLLWAKYAENGLAVRPDDLKLLDTFYRVNLERNACFMRSIAGDLSAARLSDAGARPVTDATLSAARDVIVVVAGGFHTSGLEQLLADRRITCVSITPNVTQDTKASDLVYAGLARHQARVLSQALALYVLSNCDPAEKLGAFFAAKIDAERKLGKVLKDKDIAAALADVSRVWDDVLKAEHGGMRYTLSGPDKRGGYRVTFTFEKTGRTVTMDCNRSGKAAYVDPDAAAKTGGDALSPMAPAGPKQTVRETMRSWLEPALIVLAIVFTLSGLIPVLRSVPQQPVTPAPSPTPAVERRVTASPDRQAIEQAVADSAEPLDKWFDAEMRTFFKEMQVTDSIMARNSISMAARRLLERYSVKATPETIKKATGIIEDTVWANKDRVLIDKDTYVISVQGDDPSLAGTGPDPLLRALGIGKGSVREITAGVFGSGRNKLLTDIQEMPKDRKVAIWISAVGDTLYFSLEGGERGKVSADDLAKALSLSGKDLSRVTIFLPMSHSYDFALMLLRSLSYEGVTQLPAIVTQAYRDEISFPSEALSNAIPETVRGRDAVTVADILDMQRLYRGSNPALILPAGADAVDRIAAAFSGDAKYTVSFSRIDREGLDVETATPEKQREALDTGTPALLSWAALKDVNYTGNNLPPNMNAVEGFMGKVYSTPDEGTRELQYDGVKAAVRDGYVSFEKDGKTLYTKDGAAARVKLTGKTLSGAEALKVLGNIDAMDIPAGFRDHIRAFVAGRNIRIIEDNGNIRGFHDGETLFIAASLAQDPIALFHELGEGYFNAHKQTLPRGVVAHTYLRGCGQEARKAYGNIASPRDLSAKELIRLLSAGMDRPLTASEKALIAYNRQSGYAGSPLDGLQDKVFGAKKNQRLSAALSSNAPAGPERTPGKRIRAWLEPAVALLVIVVTLVSLVSVLRSIPPRPAAPDPSPTPAAIVRQATESVDRGAIEEALANSSEPLDQWFDGEMRALFEELNVTDSIMARNSVALAAQRLLERYVVKATPSSIKKATEIVLDTIRANQDRVLIDKDAYVISVRGDDSGMAGADPAPFFRSLGIGDDSVTEIGASGGQSARYALFKAIRRLPKDRPVVIWINANVQEHYGTFSLGGADVVKGGETVATNELAQALADWNRDLSRVTVVFQSSAGYDFATTFINCFTNWGVTRWPTVITQSYRDEISFPGEALSVTLPQVIGGRDFVTAADLLELQRLYHGSNPAVIFPAAASDMARIVSAFEGEEKITARRFYDTEKYVELATPEIQEENLAWNLSPGLLSWGEIKGMYYGGSKLMREANAVEGFIGKVYDTPDAGTRELQHDGVKAAVRDGFVYFEKRGKALYTKDGAVARVKLTGGMLSGREAAGLLGRIEAMEIPAGFKDYIRAFAAERSVRIIEDNDNIGGFHDGKDLFIAARLARNPVALFHELGEGYFGAHRQMLPRGVSAHTYLRGCGQDARNAYEQIESPRDLSDRELFKRLAAATGRALTPAEKALISYNRESRYTGSPLDGLQDKVFGPRQNRQLSGALSSKVPPEPKQGTGRRIGAAAVQAVIALLIASQLFAPGLTRSPAPAMPDVERLMIARMVRESDEPLDRWFDGEMTAFFKEIKATDSIMARNSISLAARRLLERYRVKPTPASVKKATQIVEDMIRANRDRVLMDKDTYVIASQGDDPMFDLYNPRSFFTSLGIRGDSLRYFEATSDSPRQFEFLKAIKEMPKDRKVSIWICNHGETDSFLLGGEELVVRGEEISTKELAYVLVNSGADLSNVSLFFESCFSYDFAVNLINDLIELGVTDMPAIVSQSYRDQVAWMAEDMSFKIPKVIGGRDRVTVGDILDMQALFRGSNPAILLPAGAGDIAGISAAFDGFEKVDESQRYLDPEHCSSPDIPNGDFITEFFLLMQRPRPLSWSDLNDLDYRGTRLTPEAPAVEGFIGKVYDTADRGRRGLQRNGIRAAQRDGYVYFEKDGKALFTKDGAVARVKLTGETVTGATVVRTLGSPGKKRIPPAFREYIEAFRNVPAVRIIEDNGNIRGFHDGTTFFITRSLLRDPVALFHELGEGYFGAHRRMLPRGIGAHTYLRGCGQDARNAYGMIASPDGLPAGELIKALAARMDRPLTPDEKALIGYNREQGYEGSPLDGLQDRVFGARKNRQLSASVSSKVQGPALRGTGQGRWKGVLGTAAAMLVIVTLLNALPAQRGPEPVAERPEIAVTRVIEPNADRQAIERAVADSAEPLDRWFDAEMTAFFEEMQVTDSITARNSVSMAARRLLERYMVKASPETIKKAVGIVLDAVRENRDLVLIDRNTRVLLFQGDDPALAATDPSPLFRSLGIGGDSIQEIRATGDNSRRFELLKALKELPKDRPVALWLNAVGRDFEFYLGGADLVYEGESVTTYEMAFALAQAGPDLSHVTVFLPASYSYDFGVMLVNYLSELGVRKLPVVVVQAYRDEESFAGESLAGAIPRVTGDRDFVTASDIFEMQKLYRGSNPAIIFPSSAEEMARIDAAFSGDAKHPRTRQFYNRERPVTVTTPELQLENIGRQPALLSWADLDDLYYGSTKLAPETTAVEGFMGKVYDLPDAEIRELQRDGVKAAVRDGYVYFEKDGKTLYTKDGAAARVKLTGETVTGETVVNALGEIGSPEIPAEFRRYLEGFRSVPAVRIIEDNANIRGFHDGATIYITRSLMQDPVALFHELGEGYFGAHRQALPQGVNAHTYLRGCGKDAREAYRQLRSPETMAGGLLAIELNKLMPRPLTASEISLIIYNRGSRYAGSPLDGLQDRVFGREENERLSARVSRTAVRQGVAGALDRSVNPLAPVMQAIDGMNAGRQARTTTPLYTGRTLFDLNGLDGNEEDLLAAAGMNVVRFRETKMPGEPVHRLAFPLGALAGRLAAYEGIDENGFTGLSVWIARSPAAGRTAKYTVSFDCPLLSGAPGMAPEDAAAVRARAFFALADFLSVNKKAIAVAGRPLQPDVVVFGESERLNDEREALSFEAVTDRAAGHAAARVRSLFHAAVWVARLQGTPDEDAGRVRRARGADLTARAVNGPLLGRIESKMKRKYAESAARAQQDLFVRVTAGRGFDGGEQKLTAAARVADTLAPAGGQGRITLQLRKVFDGGLAGIREECIDRSVFPPAERLHEDDAVRTAFESLRRRYAPLLDARTRPDLTANERLADDYVQVQGYEQLRRLVRKAHVQGGRFVVEYAPSVAAQPGAGAARIAAGVRLFGIDGIVLDLSALPDAAAVEAWAAAVRSALPDAVLAVKAPGAARGAMKEMVDDLGCMRVEEWNGLGELPRELTGDDVLLEVSLPENADAAMLEQIASHLENARVGNISVRCVPGADGTAYTGDPLQLKPSDILRFFGRLNTAQRDPFTRGFAAAQNVRAADIPALDAGNLAFLGEPVEMTAGGTVITAPRLYALDRAFRTIEAAPGGEKLLETDEYLRAAKRMIESIPGFETRGWRFAYTEIAGALAEPDVTAQERVRMNLWLSGFYRGLLQRMAVKRFCLANELAGLPFADNGYRDREVYAALLSRALEALLDRSAPAAERAELSGLTRITVGGVTPAKERTALPPAGDVVLDPRDPASVRAYLAMLEGMIAQMRATSTRPAIEAKVRPYLVTLLGPARRGAIDRPGSIAALLRIYQLFDNRGERLSLEEPVVDNLNLILGTRRIRGAA